MRDVRGTSTWAIPRNRTIKTKQKLTGLFLKKKAISERLLMKKSVE
jgi:hypothetical protein